MLHRKVNALLVFVITTFHSIAFADSFENEVAQMLDSIVSEELANNELVSLGAAVSQNNHQIAISVAGEKVIKSEVLVSIDDKWHLGSVTKSITATMIARLVEKGVLQWDTTIGDIFKDSRINAAWKEVTLHMLLTHTAGTKSDFPWRIQSLNPKEGPERQALRKEEVLKILEDKPVYEPGADFEYSNVGYTIAAVMTATKTGKSWENLVREEVFQPLGLASGGFGPPVDINNDLEQPRGHEGSWFSGPVAVSTETDNSPIMGPAGSIHMSLTDLSTYAKEHLLGGEGKSAYLNKSTFNQLHEMGPHDYAYGWIAAQDTSWANNNEVLYHNGSNRYWFALLVLIPEVQMSIAVTTNDASNLKNARKSAWNIVKRMTTFILSNESH